jgi:HrpA-like RNA helicase
MTITVSHSPVAKEFSKPDLPVSRHKQEIIDSVVNSDITIISSETGSGKSTQIPQFILSAKHRFKRPREGKGNFKICVTQPRRVAAISLAKRVANECGESKTGGTVGYRVRFDESISTNTSICFLTDGMLVREAVLDRGTFSQYSIVVLDEVHERSLHTDILLGLISEAVKSRKSTSSPLKVVIMSATLSVESFRGFFEKYGFSVNSISIPGKAFPVSIW